LPFPPVRYSVADIDGSLDLVFGEGTPRLADLGEHDRAGYDRHLSPQFITALLSVARERVKEAALTVCSFEEDALCMELWLRTYADQLYRRPLTQAQVDAFTVPFLGVESDEARQEVAVDVLAAMVLSPYFLLRLEASAPGGRISTHDVASRLAHLATRRVPDAELRARAQSEELYDPLVRLAELHRLWQTPAGQAARELQMLEWLGIDRLPAQVDDEWQAQARRFITQVYEEESGSFSAFFTSSRLPLNDRLAERYGLSLPGTEQLEPVELDPQLFAGLLSTGAFLTRYPGPSQRGTAIMSTLFCVDVPVPPGSHVNEPLPVAETPRLRIQAATAGSAGCVPCHDAIDPPGFALEAFDAQGRLSGFPTHGALRTSLTGPSGAVSGPVALGRVATSSLVSHDCLSQRSLEFVSQREISFDFAARLLAPPDEAPELQWQRCLTNTLGGQEPSLTVLMETLAASDLMLARDDEPRRVVALDTSQDPIEHAYQEALQLRDAYAQDGVMLIPQYLSALRQLQDTAAPIGGAGSGGDSGDAGSGGAGGAP
jgi:hypothetical protein